MAPTSNGIGQQEPVWHRQQAAWFEQLDDTIEWAGWAANQAFCGNDALPDFG